MAVTLTVNTDHTASLSSRYLARQGEVGALMTVTVPSAVYALGTYAYIDFTDADGVASYLGDYDASSGTFVVSVGAADNILAKDGIVKIQFVLRDNLISESYTAVWKSQIVEAIVERSVNADTYAIPAAMPSDDPPETYEASRVSIEDVGTYYASNNVEDALQEAAVDIAQNTADIATLDSGKQDVVSGVSDAEIGYLASVTSDIQAQINTKAAAALGSVIAPTLGNSWVNFGLTFATAGYYKDNFGIVHLRGIVKSGTIGTAIFTLDVGYRPVAEENFPTVSNETFGFINVSSTGVVKCSVGDNAWVSLSGISFRTA